MCSINSKHVDVVVEVLALGLVVEVYGRGACPWFTVTRIIIMISSIVVIVVTISSSIIISIIMIIIIISSSSSSIVSREVVEVLVLGFRGGGGYC